MKVILTTLNSKFIHSNLAIRYLKSYTDDLIENKIMEFTINQSVDFIAYEIYEENPDIVGFSTYIWNLEETLEVCKILKIANPNLKIFLGGPEVSFDGDLLMEESSDIDYILYGEGEETYREFIKALQGKMNLSEIKGLIYRKGFKVIKNSKRPLIKDLNKIPSPYKNIGKEFKNKIVYYESSRGCPFNCAFCLSSTIKGVRYFDIERVKEDLGNLIDGEVRQVKFVDRTFNANKEYAKEIMNFIMEKDPKNMNFHFEVTAHLLDDDMLDFISKAKEGLFQFEIGVQSTNQRTIDAIGRTTDWDKLSKVSKKIKSFNNIHQHLDLIGGLPYEDYDRFKKSFNDVYNLKPDKLQLGFLKLLKGSKLREEESEYGYKYINKPPYEVVENDFICYEEIRKLHGIEDLVEKYFNGRYFEYTLDYIIKYHFQNNPFSFYEDLLLYWRYKGYHKVSHSRNKLYKILKEYCIFKKIDGEGLLIVENLLKYDYIYNHKKTRLPVYLKLNNESNLKWNIHDILKDELLLNEYLLKDKNRPTRDLLNKVTIESFNFNILKYIDNFEFIGNKIDIEETFILFRHRSGEMKRAKTYEINDIVRRHAR